MNFIEKIISDELIYALGWTMVHSLWQGFLVAILLGFAMIGLQKKSSKVRYEAAYFALFLVFTTSVSTFIYLYDSVATGLEINQTLILDGITLTIEGTESVQSFFQSTVSYFNTHMPMIVTIWLMGVGFFLLRLMGGLAYVQKLKHQDQIELADKWQVTFEKLLQRLPVRQTVKVVESGLATVPMVVGYFKPIILMPIGVVNQLTPQEVEAVLAHELAHIYRNDYLLNILQSLIEVVFYYHPAVWWISANVRNERENCCDDIAVQICGNSLAYVKALVTLEEIKPRPSLAMAFSGNKNQLLNRVKRILNQPQNKSNIMEKFTATCLLLAVVFVLSVSANNGFTNEPELTNENAQKNKIVESISEVDAQPNQKNVIKKVPIVADTLPDRFQGDGNFSYASDGETLQMEYDDGRIIKLRINGKRIPKDDFHKYHDRVVELLERTPEAPPAPPSPPNVSWYNPSEEQSADEEGMDIFTNDKKVIVSNDEEGNRVIIIEDENGEDSKVILKNGTININGEVFNPGLETIVLNDAFADLDKMTFDLDKMAFDLDKMTFFGDAIVIDSDFDFEMPEMPDMPDMPDMPEFPDLHFDIEGLDWPENSSWNFDTVPPFKNFDNSFEFDKNLTEDEKKELREEAREAMREYKVNHKEAMKEYKEQMREAREEQREAIQEMKEQMQEARERALENQSEAMQEARELAEEARVNAQERREEANVLRQEAMERSREVREEGLAIAREHREQAQKNNNAWKKSFEQQMRNDGFIESNGDYDFKMKQNSLKVNGQEQSSAMLDKYIKLYEQSTGKNLGDRFSIKIKKNGSNQNTAISIDN